MIAEGHILNEKHLHYMFGGDGLAAIKEMNSFMGNFTEGSTYYVHTDHLGSYQAISNSSGALVEELSYGPWGRRRKATDWEDYSLSTPPTFARGFTGHEHLPEFDLINMNGRVYDPALGRFLSPDNYVQLPDYTQSLNRYSYCLNNPLIYTDPSGEIWGWIGAMFGNYVINGMNNWVNQGMSFGQAFSPQYNPVVFSGSYSPSSNTLFNNQVNAQAMPSIMAAGQQSIGNNLTRFGGWDGYIMPELSLPREGFVGDSPLVNDNARTVEETSKPQQLFEGGYKTAWDMHYERSYLKGQWQGYINKKFSYPESSSFPKSIRKQFWFLSNSDPWNAGWNAGFVDSHYFGYVKGYKRGYNLRLYWQNRRGYIPGNWLIDTTNTYDPVSPTLPFNPFKYLKK